MEDLIGKKFRRNKYGLSLWEDEIVKIGYSLEWIVRPNIKGLPAKEVLKTIRESNKEGFVPKFWVKGKNTENLYPVNEIIIYP